MTGSVLIYKWGAITETLLCARLDENGYKYEEFAMQIKNYHADAEFAMAFMQKIHTCKPGIVFSFDYFPLISMICEINKIPYVSWIYDCPMTTLYSQTIRNACNFIFCFDKKQCEDIIQIGAQNCFHYTLAGDIRWFEKAMEKKATGQKYICDISFIGNFYNGDTNRYRSAKIAPAIREKLEQIIEEQLKCYGTYLIPDRLTEEMITEVAEQCELVLGPEYLVSAKTLVENAIGMEVSAREREQVIRRIAAKWRIRLHTTSTLPDDILLQNVDLQGYADYKTEVPYIFHKSKINLNISSKTITSGIPQRVFDILSCGGFCLTNYQKEIAEYFVDGEELVMYRSMEDLENKIQYYLQNEEEREKIARRGQEAIKKRFLLYDCFVKMLKSFE